ncbi:MAG: RluA family pseudouridine synthase [Pseudomonadota bacterium]
MPSTAGFKIHYSDTSLLVLDKSSGLLSVPGRGEDKQDCLSRRAQQLFPDGLIVHRLDMATSGLMLMARGAAMQSALSKQFENREIHKRYVAVVDGDMADLQTSPADAQGWQLIDLPIALDWPRRPLRIIDPAGKPSQTRWRAVAFDPTKPSTRVELEPLTGRSHQLRVHMQALGHPMLGCTLYAPETVTASAPRLLLHACQLGFTHPLTGQALFFESLPGF